VNPYFAAQATQPLVSDPVAISIITTIGGAIVAYFTYVKSQKVQAKKAQGVPKDRMELVIEGYEKLIVQKDAQNERDARQIKAMSEEMDRLRQLMRQLDQQLSDSQDAHERAIRENNELKEEIKRLRREYAAAKKAEEVSAV
jgi:membrane protein involved in colicin uptake